MPAKRKTPDRKLPSPKYERTRECIKRILEGETKALTCVEIFRRLADSGYPIAQSALPGVLREMANSGELEPSGARNARKYSRKAKQQVERYQPKHRDLLTAFPHPGYNVRRDRL